MLESEEEGSLGDDASPPLGKLLPLNYRRLTAAYLKRIAQSLELPTAGSADEVRTLIEGKLQETREVANVQVVVDETTTTTVKLSLMDDEGIFHEVTPYDKPSKNISERLATAERKNEVELAATRENQTTRS